MVAIFLSTLLPRPLVLQIVFRGQLLSRTGHTRPENKIKGTKDKLNDIQYTRACNMCVYNNTKVKINLLCW